MSAALLYRIAHLNDLLRTPISIGSKIKTYRPDGNRMVVPMACQEVLLSVMCRDLRRTGTGENFDEKSFFINKSQRN